MLAALNLGALGLGLAGGGLSAAVAGLVVGGALSILDVENGADIGLLIGIITGLLVAGYIAGKLSVHSHRFHGSVAGLGFAGLLVILAGFGGQADTPVLTVVWLALISAALGGLGGWQGGRKRRSPIYRGIN